MNVYLECPTIKTKSFTIRLIKQEDSKSLFKCYNDKTAVKTFREHEDYYKVKLV